MEDAKIIDLFWARNEDAIAETDAAYGRKLRFLANKILNNFEDAEESEGFPLHRFPGIGIVAHGETVSAKRLFF